MYMNIILPDNIWPQVSLWIIGKPYLFRIPKYDWEDRGVSETNIRVLSEQIWKQVQILNQYHSSKVVILSDANKHSILSGDAIVSNLTDLAIFVLASDCVPIMLHDRVSKTIWVIHAGRKWLEWDIIKKTIDVFTDKFQSKITDIQVFIWPCISQKNYQLWLDEIKPFKELYFDFIQSSIKSPWKYYLDIRNIAKKQIQDTGITVENISISSECTYENNDKFHSYRRHCHMKQKSYGNNAFGIWIS